jgi:hypothetical protein
MTSRTLQLQKKTAQTPIQSGHKTKKQRKADEAEEADKLARERRGQGNVSPDLSESFSAKFQTLAGVVPGSEEEREADQTIFLNPPGRQLVIKQQRLKGCLKRNLNRGQYCCLTRHRMMEAVGLRTE